MKYYCGHEGCDVCGVQQCAPHASEFHRRQFASVDYTICDHCLRHAIAFAVHAAQEFACGEIDPARPCGHKKEPE